MLPEELEEKKSTELQRYYPFLIPPQEPSYIEYPPWDRHTYLCMRCNAKKIRLSISAGITFKYHPRYNENVKLQAEEFQIMTLKVQKIQEPVYKVVIREDLNNHQESLRFQESHKRNHFQMEGRNTSSNLLRSLFRLLPSVIEQRYELINQIIEKYRLSITIDDFDLWIQELNIDVNKYLRIRKLRPSFINQGERHEYSLILRIILNDFLRKEAVPCYLTSKKAKRGPIKLNLICIRQILRLILVGKKKPRKNPPRR